MAVILDIDKDLLDPQDLTNFLKSPICDNWIEFLTSNLSKEIKCKRCINTFFWDKCPSCDNTFLSREILRQTS